MDIVIIILLTIATGTWVWTYWTFLKNIDKCMNDIKWCTEEIENLNSKCNDCRFYSDIIMRDMPDIKVKMNDIHDNLSGIIEVERRKLLHKKYKDMAARYTELAKEYAK